MQDDEWADTEVVLREAISRQLQLPVDQVKDIPMERAHRTGDASGHRDRTIVVKFTLFNDRDTILQAARTVKQRGIFFNEDFSQRVMMRRKELLPRMREEREKGKIAYLSFDKLVVKDRKQ